MWLAAFALSQRKFLASGRREECLLARDLTEEARILQG